MSDNVGDHELVLDQAVRFHEERLRRVGVDDRTWPRDARVTGRGSHRACDQQSWNKPQAVTPTAPTAAPHKNFQKPGGKKASYPAANCRVQAVDYSL